VTLGDVIITSH